EDALERIEVAYDPLPVVTDPEAALRPESPIIHPELGDNVHCRFQVTVGDPHRTLAEAEETITERFRVHREIGSPMETRGILAQFEAYRNQLTIWMTTQIPHLVRTYLAEMLHL